MIKSPLYLSIPGVVIPPKKYTNDDILSKVFEKFKGKNHEWERIKTGISFVFKYCGTDTRFLGQGESEQVLDYVIDASRKACELNGISLNEIDLLIYGGIYREYFEPATAMEISSKLGLNRVSAFDVTNACGGLLQAVHVASSMMNMDRNIRNAICCTVDFPDEAINFDIQTFEELSEKSAGLTLGSGASAWIISRNRFEVGGARLAAFKNTSITSGYNICKVPVTERKFQSQSSKIFELGLKHVPDEIDSMIYSLGWRKNELKHVLAHQPSQKIIENICELTGINKAIVPSIHHLYGNTINSSIPMVMDYLFQMNKLTNGDKMIFNSAAAGFSMVTGAAVWEE